MYNRKFTLERLERLWGIGIMEVQEDNLPEIEKSEHHNPLYHSKELRELLISGAKKQEIPFLFQDSFGVIFGSMRCKKETFLIGPMCIRMLDRVELHRFYRKYKVDETLEKRLKKFTLSEILDIVEALANELLQVEYSDTELLYENHLAKDTKDEDKQEKIVFDLKEGDEELYHHTYIEERKLLDSIREGRAEDALTYSRNMDADLGKLSAKELNHWKNAAIVAITLCTRAAIDGGISPSIAYKISDFYIQKSDGCTDIARLLNIGITQWKNLRIKYKER